MEDSCHPEWGLGSLTNMPFLVNAHYIYNHPVLLVYSLHSTLQCQYQKQRTKQGQSPETLTNPFRFRHRPSQSAFFAGDLEALLGVPRLLYAYGPYTHCISTRDLVPCLL